MQLTLWTYEGPPHVGAMRIATSMQGVHYVLHAPQGDTYADLLFTMIERQDRRPPVTYTTFQARDLGGDTANVVKSAIAEAYERYQPRALLVGESCTAELIQDQPGSLALGMNIPVPVVPDAAVVPVYIGDQTRGDGTVRTLAEQIALETRTRMLNPKWYEGMLEHGYEGVRQIEVHLTNTMGWSATTGQVAPWVYQQLTKTFVLDPAMRERLPALNPSASAKVANRLLEAHERRYWMPDEATLEALRRAGEELEDRLEGITVGMAA